MRSEEFQFVGLGAGPVFVLSVFALSSSHDSVFGDQFLLVFLFTVCFFFLLSVFL